MKKFFTTVLGAFVGSWLAFLIFGVVIFISGVVMVTSMSFNSVNVNTCSIYDNSVLVLNLSGNVNERAQNAEFQDIFNDNYEKPENLCDILEAVKIAKTDNRISGIVLQCNSIQAGFATTKAIRDALQDFRTSGKWIYAYGQSIAQGDYYIASVADSIFVNNVGMLDLHGIVSTIPFFKNTLDKLGVEMQIFRVGTFKSAVEPYILTEMSEPNRLQTETYVNNLWNNICDSIVVSRNIDKRTINQFVDSLATYDDPTVAVKAHLIDGVCYEHEFESKIKVALAIDEDDDINMVSTSDLINSGKIATKSKNKIAVLYASGEIAVSGQKNGINSNDLVPEIEKAAKDEDIKGLVLRVNSPGGSAFASEQIWEALEQFKKKGKPFVVSMGDYAASGGYYISCGADRIFAEPTTITGSIGIFGMVPCMQGLLTDKLGINFSYVKTNENSDMTTMKPFTPVQAAAFQRMVNNGYELFTSRCATGRNMPIEKLKSIAEGRVWDAMEAKKIGLVDEFGNTQNAIEWVARNANIENDYSVVNLPEIGNDYWNLLLDSMSEQYYEMSMRKQFGDFYNYIVEIQNLINKDQIQCRMEYIEIK